MSRVDTLMIVVIFAMMMTGCPSADGTAKPNPNMAAVIPITSNMGVAEQAIVRELNMEYNRDTAWHGEKRAKLLTAWAILKSGSKAPTFLDEEKLEEED